MDVTNEIIVRNVVLTAQSISNVVMNAPKVLAVHATISLHEERCEMSGHGL